MVVAKTEIEVRPVTSASFTDLEDLFESNATTNGCWCMWYLITNKERQAGWGEGNKQRMKKQVKDSQLPMGLLAYKEGRPIGWCAVGPRSRYPIAFGPRTKILKGTRKPEEDESVWLVPCFFVRSGERGRGYPRLAERGGRAG
jgi:hypothetical protein